MAKSDRQDKTKKLLSSPLTMANNINKNAAKASANNQRSNSFGRISALMGGLTGVSAMPTTSSNNNSSEGTTEDFNSSQSVSDNANTGTDNVSADDEAIEGAIKVSIEPEEPKELTPTLNDMKSKSKNLSRMSEQGIVNEQTGAAVVVRTDGQINLAASKYSSYKLSPKGKVTEQSMESEKITNRMRLLTDEIIINEHKMNPQLWELTDFRESPLLSNKHALIGGFTLDGHVLVKAWEPQLKRYMLIRRPWRGPMFGPILNVPEINTAIRVDDPLKVNDDILALSDKGYQVSTVIKDSKSLVGKQGVDRSGIPRNMDAMEGTDSGSGSNSSSSSSTSNPVGPAPGKGKENIPSSAEPWTVDLALKASNILGIPCDWIWGQWANESGRFNDTSRAEHNYAGLGPHNDYADDDAFLRVYTNTIRNYGACKAKTFHEFIEILQTDESPYCASPPGVEPYYEACSGALGNEGTKL